MKISYFFIILFCLLVTTCCQTEVKLSPEQVQYIRENFSSEEITYFYETIFFVDAEARNFKPFQRNTKTNKWNKDIRIKTFGDTKNKNIRELEKTVAYLNSLELPIKINIVETENYNLGIYFGDKEIIEKSTGIELPKLFKTNSGFGRFYVNSEYFIESAIIGINDSVDTIGIYKANRLLEEIVQSLGIIGDSYSHVNSVFYQGDKNLRYQEKLAKIDERILQLLYSDHICAGLTIDEFYNSFKNVIPDTEITKDDYEKFEQFIYKNSFTLKAIELFLDTAFTDKNYLINEPHIAKWHNNISYVFTEGLEKKDSLAIIKSRDLLSQFIHKPKIFPVPNENFNANLLIMYNNSQNSSDKQGYVGKDMLDYQIYKAIIKLPRNEAIPTNFREKIVLENLLKIMGLRVETENYRNPSSQIFTDLDDSLPLLSKYDKELLQLFFSNTLKSGMTKTDILRILKKYYPLNKL